MSEQSKIGPDHDDNSALKDRRCRVRDAKASDVELLDAYSRAVETVVEAVAPPASESGSSPAMSDRLFQWAGPVRVL